MDEAARLLGIDPLALRLRNLARRGDAFIPGDTPADGDWATTVERAAELIGWGSPPAAGRGRGIAVGLKSGPTTGLSYSTVRLLADGSVIVYAGTSDMGQGARTIFAQIAAQELGCAARLGHGRHGRHRRRPVRPADLGEPVVGADGQRRSSTAAARSRRSCGRWPRGSSRSRRPPSWSIAARSGSASASCPIRDVLIRGLGRLGGEVIGIGEMRKEAEPGPSARRDGRVLRVQLHGRRGRGRPGDRRHRRRPARHGLGRRQGAQPDPGPRPGRGRRGHGPRPHVDGAATSYDDDRPDPEPRRHRLPDPDEHGPAAADGERHHRARGRARARTARRA